MKQEIKIPYFKFGTEYAADELAEQVLEFTAGTGAKGGVIGLSGGIDSTTTAYLCKYAFDSYNRENPDKKPLKLFGLIMPSKVNDKKDSKDGLRVADSLDIERKIIEIEPFTELFKNTIPEVLEDSFDVGNLYSEIRAVILSRYAGAKNYRVMGTGNYDEDYVLGYFTKRGDGAVDNNILGNVPKHLVRELGSYLGVDKDLVDKVSTAGLEPNQTDEKDIGYDYLTADIIQRFYDQKKSAKEIQKITDYDINIIKDVAKRHRQTKHKRQLPPVGKVSLMYG